MTDPYNLLYNGDLSEGSVGFTSTTQFTIADSTLTFSSTGGWSRPLHDYYIPINIANTYSLSIDKKGNSGTGVCYMCFISYDKYFNEISINLIEHAGPTTLKLDLKNGDTIVYLNSVANWYTTWTYRYVGICDSKAYGYNRAIYILKYDSSSVSTTNNTVTLQQPWAGGTWLAGTPVLAFSDGGTFIYPISWINTVDTGYTHLTGSATLRHSAAYMRLGTICYSGTSYSLRNIRLYNNTNKTQIRQTLFSDIATPSLNNKGIFKLSDIGDGFMPVRYIRDYLNGSTVNSGNHWCEILAFDRNLYNIGYASNGTASSSIGLSGVSPNNISNSYSKPYHTITNNSIVTSPYLYTAGGSLLYVLIDLGSIVDINKIKVWHYFGDGRTYHNTKTLVSADGINWITVFDSAIEGEYAESSAGHTIYCNPISQLSKLSKLISNSLSEL